MLFKKRDNRIDVEKYSPSLFYDKAEELHKEAIATYKAKNYRDYIKNYCKMYFYGFCGGIFKPELGNELVPLEDRFLCMIISDSNTTHEVISFKKLGLEKNIPMFNASFADFLKSMKKDILQISAIITEHHQRWRNMNSMEKIKLKEFLLKKYRTANPSNVYDSYFIYNNSFLREKFEQYYGGKSFDTWWNSIVTKLL